MTNNMSAGEEAQLLSAVKANDWRAEKQFYDHMFPQLAQMAYLITFDKMEAEDIASTAIRKTLAGRDKFDTLKTCIGYARKIVKNQSLNYLKKIKAREGLYKIVFQEIKMSDANACFIMLRRIAESEIHGIIKELDNRDQLIAKYELFENLSTEEIADMLKMNKKTLQNRRKKILDYIWKEVRGIVSARVLTIIG